MSHGGRGGLVVHKVNEFELSYRHGDSGPKYLFRGPKIEWGVVAFTPGQSLGKHYHEEVEETFYFIEGTPLIIIEGKKFRVEVGDAFRVEPREAHDIINDTDNPTKAVFIKTPYLPKDKVSVKE